MKQKKTTKKNRQDYIDYKKEEMFCCVDFWAIEECACA